MSTPGEFSLFHSQKLQANPSMRLAETHDTDMVHSRKWRKKNVKVLGLYGNMIRQTPVLSYAYMHSMFCCVDLKRRTKEPASYFGNPGFIPQLAERLN
jgi:hypothetical protein